MVDIITDSYDFTVEVIQHGDLAISNVIHPTIVEPGETFMVSYDVTNNGATDTCFGKIMSIGPSEETEIAGTRWQETIPAGTTKNFSPTITGRATNLVARIEVGYYTE